MNGRMPRCNKGKIVVRHIDNNCVELFASRARVRIPSVVLGT